MSRHTVDGLVREVDGLASAGRAGACCCSASRTRRTTRARGAWVDDGIVQQALRALRERFPELLLLTDVCLCEYTDHGHCGVLRGGEVDNDATLELLARTAVSHVEAGADVVARAT